MTTSPPAVSGALIDRPHSAEGAAVVCLEYGVERDGQGQQVAVVDSAVVELASEVAEQPWPILAPGYDRCGNVHPSLDDPDSSEAGGDRSGLFPGPLPAGRRTPLRESTRRLEGDRPTAPPARRRGQPLGLHFGLDRRRRTCARVTGRGSARVRWRLGPRSAYQRLRPSRCIAAPAHTGDGPDKCPGRRHPDASRRNGQSWMHQVCGT
jgi:hypothetical protein